MERYRLDVCLACPLFYPAFTGAGTRFRRYAPGLRARGVDLRVFTAQVSESNMPTGESKYSAILPTEYLDDLSIQRVHLIERPKWRRHLMFASALVSYCREPSARPDLIQSLSASPFWLPHWFSFRRIAIPLVITKTMEEELSSTFWKRCLQRFYLRLPYEMADCVVVSSSIARDSLRSMGISNRIEVIPHGVDLNHFRPVDLTQARHVLRKELGLDPEGEVILFVGAVVERKGVDVLFEAWRFVAQARAKAYLVLVGPPASEVPQEKNAPGFDARIKAAIRVSGASDRIILTGRVDNIAAYYQAADLLVFPSRKEGMPNAVLEAFGCGLATILTPFLGLSSELGRPDEHYILTDRTPEALAKSIIALCENPERRYQLGRQSRVWVENQLDIEMSLDHYASLYRELVDRSGAGKRRGRV